MIYTGTQFRTIQERSELSFAGNFVVDNASGHAAFGFSGNGNLLKFDFKSGKIYDPEGRYVNSYRAKELFSISGSYKTGTYNYFINNNPICVSGNVSNFDIERFFGTTTNCQLDTSGFFIDASGEGDVQFTDIPSTFDAGDLKTIKVVNTGHGKDIGVFSGQFIDFNTGAGNVNNIFTVEQKPSGIAKSATGDLGIRISDFTGISGIANNSTYELQVELYTTAGPRQKNFRISGIDIDKEVFFDVTKNLNNFIGTGTGVQSGKIVSGGAYNSTKSGDFSINYAYYSGGLYPTGFPLHLTLKYSSGVTGVMSGMITGVNIVNSGSGYRSAPLIKVVGGGGEGASVSGLVVGERLSGINLIHAGRNYTSTPTINILQNVNTITVTSEGSGYLAPPQILISGGGGNFASGSGFVATGFHSGTLESINLVSFGSGYTGTPTVTFPTTCVGGGILQSGGSGYTGHPLVTFSGVDGKGQASGMGLVGSQITGVEIVNSGAGYTGVPTVIFSSEFFVPSDTKQYIYEGKAGLAGGVNATGSALMSFSITGATLTHSGSGYNCSPTIWFTGNTDSKFSNATQASGIGLTGNPNSDLSGFLTGIRIVATGGFYTGTPDTFISGCNATITGSGIAHLGSGFVTGVKIINKGINYTGIPVVTFSGGLNPFISRSISAGETPTNTNSGIFSGTGLVLTGNPTGAVLDIKMFTGSNHTNSGFTSTPSVLFSSRGQSVAASATAFIGTGAVAVANMSTGASALAVTGSYIKSFTGTWKIMTGSGIHAPTGIVSPNAGGTIYDNGIYYTKSGDYYGAAVENTNYYDDNLMVAEFQVSGLGASGDYYYTKFLTGVR